MEPETPAAPAESDVIRLAREATGLSALAAAEATRAHDGKGVSVTYWRDVERGYGGRRGQRVATRASARALAAMAMAVGVQPAQLTKAGREDAARVLEEILRRGPAPAPEPPAHEAEELARAMGIDPDDPNDPFLRPVRQEIADATMEYGAAATGSQIFRGQPASAIEANLWDNRQLGRKAKELAIAILRADRARHEAGRSGGSRPAAGLTPRLTVAGRR